MGSIASVLQWHCSECALINPTESARCARCGLTRLKSDERVSRTTVVRSASVSEEGEITVIAITGGSEDTTKQYGDIVYSGESTPPSRNDRLVHNTTVTQSSKERGKSQYAVTHR